MRTVSDGVGESANYIQYMGLEAAHGTVRKGLREDSPLPRVQALVNGTVRAPRSFRSWKCGVKVGFPDIGFEAIDFLQSLVAVKGDVVRTIADHLAVLLV